MRISLRYKFILAFIAFTVVVATSFGVISAQRMTARLHVQYERHAQHFAAHAAEEVLESLLFQSGHDPALLARNLLIEDVVYVQIVVDGQVWTEENKLDLKLSLSPEPEQSRVETIPSNDGSAAHLDVIQPLHQAVGVLAQFGHQMTGEGWRRLREGIHGYVRLGVSLTHLQQEVQQEALLLTGVSLGLMILGILFGWILYRTILAPIERLSGTVREFGAGNANARARVSSGDEIESLAHEFNTMAESIVFQRDTLKETNQQLEKANRVKSTFLATISHELRTPLHAVVGYASLLRDEVNVTLNEAGRKYAEAILRSGKHLLALIQNLIDFTRSESGAESLRPIPIQVADLIQEVLDNQRPLLKKDLTLASDIEPDLTLHTDRVKLEQVLLNLLNNAIRYTDQGQVRIVVRNEGRGVCFEVSDTGSGISPETQPNLFNPFTRGDNARHNREGLGLGLAVAKRYVELLGGHICFESALGKGSRFWFTLPQKANG